MAFTEQYGEYTIRFNVNSDLWEAFIQDCKAASSEKLSALKKRLDASGEKAKAFTRVPVFKFENDWGNQRKVIRGMVTSIDEDGYRWVTWSDKKRSKEHRTTILFLDTPKNAHILDKVQAMELEIQKAEQEYEEIVGTMATYSGK